MVLSEKAVLRQLEEGCYTFLIIKNNRALGNKVYFGEFLAILDYCFTRFKYSTKHIYNQLVLKAYFCICKKVVKLPLKRRKQTR